MTLSFLVLRLFLLFLGLSHFQGGAHTHHLIILVPAFRHGLLLVFPPPFLKKKKKGGGKEKKHTGIGFFQRPRSSS